MINSQCGYQNVAGRPRLWKKGSCGRWVGFHPLPLLGYLPITPQRPHFIRGIAWCGECAKGFKVKHLGQGVFVRPRTNDDKVTAKGPKLEELFS